MYRLAPQGDEHGGPAPAGAPRGAAAEGGEGGILVVEDEWLISTEIEALLEDAGHRVAGIATSADEAVALAGLYRPRLVLMDIRLDGPRDGVDAALEILRRFGIRSLFVTANTDRRTRERGEAAGPLAWISKPYTGAALVAGVESALREIGAPPDDDEAG